MFPSGLGLFKDITCPKLSNCLFSTNCFFSHVPLVPSKQTIKKQKLNNSASLPKSFAVDIKSQASTSYDYQTKNTTKPSIIQPAKPLDLAAAPIIIAQLHSNVPRDQRQKTLLKFFEEFIRIYRPILAQLPDLAHKHSLGQEEKIFLKSKSKGIYLSYAVSTLKSLRKRPLAKDTTDVGIDGEWIDVSLKPKKFEVVPFMKAVQRYICTKEDLSKMNYPSDNIFAESEQEVKKSEQQEKELAQEGLKNQVVEKVNCERCRLDFEPQSSLCKIDYNVCRYHDGYMMSHQTKSNGKERVHSCCLSIKGTPGCSIGPHVFKHESTKKLHSIKPFTKFPAHLQTHQKIVALDCEMSYCLTGLEAVRITLIDFENHTLVDEIIKPISDVIDANTKFSGVSLEQIQASTNTHDEIVGLLSEFIGSETVIVGHGLENDLNVLRVVHDRIIDTAFIYPHPNGLPYRYSLRMLASKLLNKGIQEDSNGKSGHDSKEDCIACVELVKKKVQNGDLYNILSV